MSFPLFITVRPSLLTSPNQFGEVPLPYAPSIRLHNGTMAVPQQFLKVERTLENLENVLAQITVPEEYLLFAGQEEGLLFIVVGILGVENYPRAGASVCSPKIVYGRRWLIEASTPTSEIVQTALLAVKKAREHELRERFVVRLSTGVKATPFNCHLDLPLMAGNSDELTSHQQSLQDSDGVHQLLASVHVDGRVVRLEEFMPFSNGYVLSVEVIDCHNAGQFTDLVGRPITFICQSLEPDHLLHRLFEACLAESDRWVQEQVEFMGFARFSQQLSPLAMAAFSAQTRRIKVSDTRFASEFADMSYQVDAAKAPMLNQGLLGKQQRLWLERQTNLLGYLPKE